MKIKVIINSRSNVDSAWRTAARISDRLSAYDFEITQTEYHGHTIELSRESVKNGFDIVVGAGGDGTINEIINGTFGYDVPIGIIPCGAANDLASNLGIPKNIERACDIILRGGIQRIDLIKVNGWSFITSGGIGLPCDVLAEITNGDGQRISNRQAAFFCGGRIYALALLKVLLKGKHYGRQISLTGENLHYNIKASSLIIGNQPFLGGNFKTLPKAVSNDGFFDVCLIEKVDNRIHFYTTLLKILSGKHIGREDVRFFRAKKIFIQSNKPLDFFGDGELRLRENLFDIQLIPRAARIIVPAAL